FARAAQRSRVTADTEPADLVGLAAMIAAHRSVVPGAAQAYVRIGAYLTGRTALVLTPLIRTVVARIGRTAETACLIGALGTRRAAAIQTCRTAARRAA